MKDLSEGKEMREVMEKVVEVDDVVGLEEAKLTSRIDREGENEFEDHEIQGVKKDENRNKETEVHNNENSTEEEPTNKPSDHSEEDFLVKKEVVEDEEDPDNPDEVVEVEEGAGEQREAAVHAEVLLARLQEADLVEPVPPHRWELADGIGYDWPMMELAGM